MMTLIKPVHFWPVFRRGLLVAAVVGPILTLINQFDGIFGAGPFHWTNFALTICVPFCVSSVSGLLAQRSASEDLQRQTAAHDTALARLNNEVAKLKNDLCAERKQTADLGANHLENHNRQAAIGGVTQIKTNAQKVNTSSVERVQFIAALIGRFESVQETIVQLQGEAAQTQDALTLVDDSSARISKGMADMIAGATTLSETMGAMGHVRSEFEAHFEDVTKATAALSELAAQIRLLALNASVEAANAGDAGKGFSVIALEVRQLADTANNDVKQINTVLTTLEAAQKRMTSQMNDVEERISQSRQRARDCSDVSKEASHHISDVSATMRRFSADMTSQLPQILSLIDGVRQIKDNTEAAIEGSARNMSLCDNVLQELDKPESKTPICAVA